MPAHRSDFVRTLLRWGSTPISFKRPDLLSGTRILILVAICWDIWLVLLQFSRIALDAPSHLADGPASFAYVGGEKIPAEQLIPAIRVTLIGTLACHALALPALLRLLGIVNSARNGDPFTPENGARLRHIGWLMLAIFGVVAAITYLVPFWVARYVFPFSFIAVLTALVIFVLARIFDTGSRMRTELQETV